MSTNGGFKSLEVYNLSKKLVVACYELTHELPEEERKNLTHYIRMAALTVHVNVAQGAFLTSNKKRKKFAVNAQTSLVVIDAATEILAELGLVKPEDLNDVMVLSSGCYQLLDELKKK